MAVFTFAGRVVAGVWWLLVGLVVAGKHLLRRAITVQYPKQRFPQWERFRGRMAMVADEKGAHKCTACGQCLRICPAACIFVERHKEEGVKGFVVDRYAIDIGLCIYCGLCVEACTFGALTMVPEYELSVFDKTELIYDIPKLLGRQQAPVFKR